jgi:hypothetical protein
MCGTVFRSTRLAFTLIFLLGIFKGGGNVAYVFTVCMDFDLHLHINERGLYMRRASARQCTVTMNKIWSILECNIGDEDKLIIRGV